MAKRQTADVWLFRRTSSCGPPKVVLFVGIDGQFCPVCRLPAMQNTVFCKRESRLRHRDTPPMALQKAVFRLPKGRILRHVTPQGLHTLTVKRRNILQTRALRFAHEKRPYFRPAAIHSRTTPFSRANANQNASNKPVGVTRRKPPPTTGTRPNTGNVT